jgi:hypothetical protein
MVYYFGAILIAMASVLLAIVLTRWIVVRRLVQLNKPARGLFRFNDGVRIRSIDPIDVAMALEAHPEFRFDLHPLRAANGETEAYGVIADAVRVAFGVPAYTVPNVPGLTVLECYELYRAFVNYVALQKKSTDPMPISALDMVATSTGFEQETTSGISASGSIATAL